MKTILYNGSRKISVDTGHDECLYAAPRPAKKTADVQHGGKDLSAPMDREKNPTYYLHIWSTTKETNDKILHVSPQTRNGI